MSKLNELIAELCPNGVNYRYLWEVTIWDKKFNSVEREKQTKVISYPYLLASDMFALQMETGDVFLLSTGEQTGWTNEELAGNYLCEGEIVTIPWGKSRSVTDCIKYYKGKFVTADNRIATSSDTTVLMNKYLYYWMMSQGKTIDTFYRGAGIQHPSMKAVLDMQIPVPPLSIQGEIVRILDDFTNLITELTAELVARKQQYEYYRDSLLAFNDVHGGAFDAGKYLAERLGDICPIERGVRVVRSELEESIGIPVYQNSLIPLGYHTKANRKAQTPFVIGAGGAGQIGFSYEEYWAADDCYTFTHNERINDRYLYFVLQKYSHKIASQVRKASIPRLPREALENLRIAIPPLDVQENIVRILDNFDTICNDLSKGLPAEIEARQKQYEYYRDKLLTFNPAV